MNASNTLENGSLHGTALPQPLSPDSFQDAPSMGTTTSNASYVDTDANDAGDDIVLSANDRISLNVTLHALKTARTNLASADNLKAKAAHWQILTTVSHLTGFLDAKGLARNAVPNQGFQGLFYSPEPPRLNLWLDSIEAALAQLLAVPPETRSFKKAAIGAIGRILFAQGAAEVVGSAFEFFNPATP